MKIRDERKCHYISVRKVISFWQKGGIKAVEALLMNPKNIIEIDSWVLKIKKLIEEKKYLSADAEIKLVSNIFNIEKNDGEDKN